MRDVCVCIGRILICGSEGGVALLYGSVPASLGDSDFVPLGGGNGVRIPIWRSVRVDVNPGREAALLLLVIVIGAGHYSSSVIVSGGVVAVVGFLAREGEVDP